MYKEVNVKEDITKAELRILEYWEMNNIAKKSEDFRKDNKKFVFYEGPPTANGMPGIHHVISRTIKDAVCRYKTMRGYQVKRKAGWDTHGLPVEIEVEKQLGIETKADIEEYGRCYCELFVSQDWIDGKLPNTPVPERRPAEKFLDFD